CAARKQLVAIDQIEKRHRFSAQRMDYVMIVNHMVMLLAALWRPAASQGQELRRAEKAFKPVVVEPHAKMMADQTRRNGVERAPQQEAAARRDPDARLLVIDRSPLRQRLERRSFDLDTLAIASVASSHHLINEAPVSGKMLELMRTAQQELVTQR